MANTRAYLDAEAWIRDQGLAELYPSVKFSKRRLTIGMRHDGTPALHEFDAVSDDGAIVIAIKSSSGTTSGGNAPTGQIKDAFAESLFLSRAPARTRILLFTRRDLFDRFRRESDGRIPEGIEIKLVELPDDLASQVQAARAGARLEQGRPGEDHWRSRMRHW